ncbi:hypothetical protein AGMMS49975_15600 [Clostridia bacterium]|nr:hypothetical protein AGMMS49975_15600 [Clostridia bacterium]
MEELLERYSSLQRKIIADYWELMACSRKFGNVSSGIKKTEMTYWKRFEIEVVIAALQVHINTEKYHDRRERYTRGIIRNIDEQTQSGSYQKPQGLADKKRSKNRFINFDGGKVDYDEIRRLEKEYIKSLVADEKDDKAAPRKICAKRYRSRFANFEGRVIDYDELDRLEEEYISSRYGDMEGE